MFKRFIRILDEVKEIQRLCNIVILVNAFVVFLVAFFIFCVTRLISIYFFFSIQELNIIVSSRCDRRIARVFLDCIQ